MQWAWLPWHKSASLLCPHGVPWPWSGCSENFCRQLCFSPRLGIVKFSYLYARLTWPLSICLVSSSTGAVLSRLLAAANPLLSVYSSSPLPILPNKWRCSLLLSLSQYQLLQLLLLLLRFPCEYMREKQMCSILFGAARSPVIDCRHTFAILLPAQKWRTKNNASSSSTIVFFCFFVVVVVFATLIGSETKHLRQSNRSLESSQRRPRHGQARQHQPPLKLPKPRQVSCWRCRHCHGCGQP